jgi:hypothetical protein
MNLSRTINFRVCLSILSVTGWIAASQILLAGDLNTEMQRTTAIADVAGIDVANLTDNTVRLAIPPDVVPPNGSEVPVFRPASDQHAHFEMPTLVLPETVLPTTATGKEVAWWDTEITVVKGTSSPPEQDVMISIDKDVYNDTKYHWTDFHMELLRIPPTGGEPKLSDEFDFLFFKDEPPPISTDGKFMDPPKKDEPVAPDQLWWDYNPPANPGVWPGELARFWFGINVPAEMFEGGVARFILREHATIPEPTALALLSTAMIGLTLAIRNRRMR